jgi:hypothetical protein
VKDLVGLVQKGDFELSRDGQPVKDPGNLSSILGGELEGALQRIAHGALLVP